MSERNGLRYGLLGLGLLILLALLARQPWRRQWWQPLIMRARLKSLVSYLV